MVIFWIYLLSLFSGITIENAQVYSNVLKSSDVYRGIVILLT